MYVKPGFCIHICQPAILAQRFPDDQKGLFTGTGSSPREPANRSDSAKISAGARGAGRNERGRATSLPNQAILLDTLFLQEALASSEIENIVTTQDEASQRPLSLICIELVYASTTGRPLV